MEEYVDSSSEFYLEQLFFDVMIDEEPCENPWTEDFVLQLPLSYLVFWEN